MAHEQIGDIDPTFIYETSQAFRHIEGIHAEAAALYFVYSYEPAQIAMRLNVTEEQARQLAYAGMGQLKEFLDQEKDS